MAQICAVQHAMTSHLNLEQVHEGWKYITCLDINPLKLSGNYIYHLLHQSVTQRFIHVFRMFLTANSDYFLKQPLTG
jgi:hypothetical protein